MLLTALLTAAEASPSPPSAPPSVPSTCPCIGTYPTGVTSDGTVLSVEILGQSYSYPPTYGLGCSPHDAGLQPYCATTHSGTYSPLDNPRWCSSSWCYVNVSNCNVTYEEGAYNLGANLSFSYDT